MKTTLDTFICNITLALLRISFLIPNLINIKIVSSDLMSPICNHTWYIAANLAILQSLTLKLTSSSKLLNMPLHGLIPAATRIVNQTQIHKLWSSLIVYQIEIVSLHLLKFGMKSERSLSLWSNTYYEYQQYFGYFPLSEHEGMLSTSISHQSFDFEDEGEAW